MELKREIQNTELRVLLVEDNPFDAKLIQEYLTETGNPGFEVLWMDRLSKGLEFLERNRVDIVLLDLTLPNSSGLDTLGKVHAKANEVPIVVLTVLDDETIGLKAVHEGAQGYLVKGGMDKNLLLHSMQYAVERKKEEEKLRLNNNRLEALYTLSQMINKPEKAIKDFALETSTAMTKSEIGYIYFMNEDETELTLHAWSKNVMKECTMIEKPILYKVEETGLWGEAVRQRRPVITNDYDAPNPHKRGYPEGHVPIKRHMNIPLIDNGKIVLIAGVGNKEDEYDEMDVRQLILIMDGMWRIIQRKKAEETLQLSEAKYRNLAENLSELVYCADPETFVATYVNQNIKNIYGYTAEEWLADPMLWKKTIHSEDRESIIAFFEEAHKSGKESAIEYRIVRRDGAVRWVEDHFTWERDGNGNVLAIDGVLSDITERKNVEEKLRLAAGVFEGAAESIIISDGDNNIIEVNEAFTRTTGYSAEEIIGRPLQMLRSEKHDESFYRDIWKSVNKTGSWRGEVWDRRKNGELFPGLVTISAIRDNNGDISNYVSIFYDISENKKIEERVRHLAYYDPLTDLPNRKLLYDRMDQALARAKRHSQSVALLFLDLDDFKNINDTLGHPYGDILLRSVAKRLTKNLRRCNTIARLGGDEFTILLDDISDQRSATKVARRIIDLLSEPFELDQDEIFVSTSIGISLYPDDSEDIEELMKNADTAMYHAKDNGKNNYQFFSAEMNANAKERLLLETNLRHALEREEFLLHYQPQIDLKSGRIIGQEALVRWQHPDFGLVSPARFIPVAEETRLIVAIDEWVLRKACKQIKAWVEMGYESLCVAVNFSGQNLNEKKYVETVEQILIETGISPKHLELEITEGILMKDVQGAISTLKRLKSLGVQLAIDDFGTGYSSLSYLKYFPIDKLKIDQSFVNDIPEDPDAVAIAKTIITLARNLNLRVIAEGVETKEQLDFLREEGCDEIQGYYFSRPLATDEFTKLLMDGKKID